MASHCQEVAFAPPLMPPMPTGLDKEREIIRETQLRHEIGQRRLAGVQEHQAKFEEISRRQSFELEKNYGNRK